MKRTSLLFALTFVLLVGNVSASEFEDVNKKVISSFNKEFVAAKNIKWSSADNFLKVSFTLNEHSFFAYYSAEGERIALTRHIEIRNLPLNLSAEIQNSYSSYWITDAFEVVGKTDSAYYAIIESADYRITLKSASLSEWSIFKRESKN